MTTAFLRSPADSLAGLTAKDKMRRRRRGLLLQGDSDQDFGPYAGPTVPHAGQGLERRTGGQGTGPNMTQNRDITFGSGNARPQDTKVGTVGQGQPRVAQYQGKSGSVGQEPTARDVPGESVAAQALDKSGQDLSRDGGGSMAPGGDKFLEPMSDGEVQSAVHKMVWDAIEYIDQELSPFRALATKYYQGEPFGNEEEGRSAVVMTEVRDTILMVMPSLMRIFMSPERPMEYSPFNRTDQIEMAEQATEYVWEVVFHQDNRGYMVFWEWFKDALLKRLGIVKYWWDDSSETRAFETSFLSDDAIALLTQDDTIRIDEMVPSRGAPPGAQLYDVKYTQTKSEGRIRFIGLPPEEFLFTRGARAVESDHSQPGVALFVGHRTELTRSQLLEMGVPEDVIEEWAFKDVSLDMNEEEIARQHIVKPDTSAIGPIATQKALYIEGYPYMDVDGDGVAELRRVCMLGPSYHVISNEAWDERPFAVICPDPEPHTIVGQSIADYTMDLQKINSMILRATLDSLALSLNPRMGFVEGDVNLTDILNPEVGAPIRMRSPNAVQVIEHQFVGQAALPVLEKMIDIKEQRTGITKASAGLDADALQSTTKAAVAATVTAAQQHIETIARTFAETGVMQLFRGILRLLVAHQAPERIVKMRGNYVPMDPRAWDADLPIRVKVAIGAGLDDEKYQALAEAAVKMEGIFNTMGLDNPIVSPKQYRDTLVEMLKLRGRVDAEQHFKDVPANWQPPQKQPNDPNMVIAMAEKQKADSHVQKEQAGVQLEQQKHQADQAKQQADAQQKERGMMMEAALEREKLALEEKLRREEMLLQDQREREKMQLEHQRELQKQATDREVAHTKIQADKESKEKIAETTAEATKEAAKEKPEKEEKADRTIKVVVSHEGGKPKVKVDNG
jgi:hypothetical protein